MAERIKPKVSISINGLEFSEDTARELEAEVQNLVARLFERGPRPQLQKESTGKTLQSVGESGGIKISSSVQGLTIQDNEEFGVGLMEIIERLETQGKIRKIVRPSGAVPIPCVFVNSPWPANDIGLVPDWRKVNQSLPQLYALQWGTDDTLKLEIKERTNLSAGRMSVKLESAPNVMWGKAINAWNYNTGRINQVLTRDSNHGPNEMILTTGCSDTNTLMFEKQMGLGIWTGLYTLRIEGIPESKQSEEFANAFGRKELHFTWMQDNVWHGAVGFTSF